MLGRGWGEPCSTASLADRHGVRQSDPDTRAARASRAAQQPRGPRLHRQTDRAAAPNTHSHSRQDRGQASSGDIDPDHVSNYSIKKCPRRAQKPTEGGSRRATASRAVFQGGTGGASRRASMTLYRRAQSGRVYGPDQRQTQGKRCAQEDGPREEEEDTREERLRRRDSSSFRMAQRRLREPQNVFQRARPAGWYPTADAAM
jgi:hypothetical protein